MCGFLFYLDKSNNIKNNTFKKLDKISNLLSHRGPDFKRSTVYKNIFIHHSRLSIQDINKRSIEDIPMMEGIYSIEDFNFVFDLSAGVPGNAEWVQFACDEYNIPLSSGCTSIMVTDAIPYVESGQIRGILAGMPGAAEYETLVYDYLNKLDNNKFMNKGVSIIPGKATSRMSAQSIAHLLMVVFIIFGNISYYLIRRDK